MSKSLNNAIFLNDSPEEVDGKVMNMFTDPKRVSADVPGTVEGNPVFIYHDAFNTDLAEVEDLKTRYRAGKVGDVEVKQKLTVAVNAMLDPIRERRSLYETPGLVEQILFEGTAKVRGEVKQTLFEMQQAMGLTGVWNHIEQKANLHSAFFGG
jgi:tryptophanyl-tRNA synthetase